MYSSSVGGLHREHGSVVMVVQVRVRVWEGKGRGKFFKRRPRRVCMSNEQGIQALRRCKPEPEEGRERRKKDVYEKERKTKRDITRHNNR